MELQKFISESINEIMDGVRESIAYAKEHGGEVSPEGLYSSGSDIPRKSDGTRPLMVEFDVAVSASEGKNTEGGIGIYVGSVGLGSKGASEAEHSTVSRLRFSVPIVLPTQEGTRVEPKRTSLSETQRRRKTRTLA